VFTRPIKEQGIRHREQGTRNKEQEQVLPKQDLTIKPMSQELEDRVRDFCLKLKWDSINIEYIRQLIRSSGSIGANYIEASDDLGKMDEKMKIKIARRESKETTHWLDLILTFGNNDLDRERLELTDEAIQIKKILSTILKRLGS